MKKFISILIMIAILSLPTIVFAHTELKESSPKEGEIVKVDLTEVMLQFEGEIEDLSTMILLKDGEEIPFDQIQLSEQQMLGTLSEPLQNGSYIIQWKIAGEDGHPIEGNVPFAVQIEQKDENQKPSPSNQEHEEEQVIKQDEKPTNHQETNTHNESNGVSPNTIGTVTTVVLVLILIVGVRLLFRKKS